MQFGSSGQIHVCVCRHELTSLVACLCMSEGVDATGLFAHSELTYLERLEEFEEAVWSCGEEGVMAAPVDPPTGQSQGGEDEGESVCEDWPLSEKPSMSLLSPSLLCPCHHCSSSSGQH